MKAPGNYEAWGNIMWASSWALNRFPSGQLTALPRVLSHEKSAHLYHELAVNVFGISPELDPMEAGRQVIAGNSSSKPAASNRVSANAGVTGTDKFTEMARVACRGGVIHGFVDLTQKNVITYPVVQAIRYEFSFHLQGLR